MRFVREINRWTTRKEAEDIERNKAISSLSLSTGKSEKGERKLNKKELARKVLSCPLVIHCWGKKKHQRNNNKKQPTHTLRTRNTTNTTIGRFLLPYFVPCCLPMYCTTNKLPFVWSNWIEGAHIHHPSSFLWLFSSIDTISLSLSSFLIHFNHFNSSVFSLVETSIQALPLASFSYSMVWNVSKDVDKFFEKLTSKMFAPLWIGWPVKRKERLSLSEQSPFLRQCSFKKFPSEYAPLSCVWNWEIFESPLALDKSWEFLHDFFRLLFWYIALFPLVKRQNCEQSTWMRTSASHFWKSSPWNLLLSSIQHSWVSLFVRIVY